MNYTEEKLGALADPSQFVDPLEIEGQSPQALLHYLRSMIMIRSVEEAIADLIMQEEVRCPCHLAVGQEAIAVGVSTALQKTDHVFGNHRSHAHYLALGGSIEKLFAEILGKETGCSRGMGGSMHLIDEARGFRGSVPIVSGTIPIAVGAALAQKMKGSKNISVSYFGDGATEEGGFHEAMNFASTYKLPILFVCENNFYSSHLDISLRQPSNQVARFAVAHCVESVVVDGNDVISIARETEKLVDFIREGKGPAFLEAVTYRWRGHVGPKEDIDVGVRRKKVDLEAWKRRDPIRRLRDSLHQKKILTDQGYNSLYSEVNAQISSAIELARKAPYPPGRNLLDLVYSET